MTDDALNVISDVLLDLKHLLELADVSRPGTDCKILMAPVGNTEVAKRGPECHMNMLQHPMTRKHSPGDSPSPTRKMLFDLWRRTSLPVGRRSASLTRAITA